MQIIQETDKTARRNILMNLLAEQGYSSIQDFQKANKLEVDGLFGLMSYGKLYDLILKPKNPLKPFSDYFGFKYQKKQIVWHHTAGSDNPFNVYSWWANDGVAGVSTSVAIGGNGTLVRGFDESFWSHHLGMSNAYNYVRNQEAVAVEVCNYGCFVEKEGKLIHPDYGNELPREKAIQLDYKGYKFYEVYTDAQLKTLKYWTLLNAMRFGIPLVYRHEDMWQVSNDGIRGKSGIFTHNSYLSWKTDVSPQPKLIEMAKGLALYEAPRR